MSIDNNVKEKLANLALSGREYRITKSSNGYLIVVNINGDIEKAIKAIKREYGTDANWADVQRLSKAIETQQLNNSVEIKIKDAYRLAVIAPSQEELQEEFKRILNSNSIAKLGDKEVVSICIGGKETYKAITETEEENQ